MTNIDKHLGDITEMRRLMDRSSRFISLSGLSGIAAGSIALIGAYAAYKAMNNQLFSLRDYQPDSAERVFNMRAETSVELTIIALVVLVFAMLSAFILTWRKARRNGESLLNPASRKMMVNMFIPLITGGLFCLVLLYQGMYGLVAPATLIFYGLACVNASHYTLSEIKYIGFFNILLGLVNCWFIGYGLLFWAFGFGVLHIFYGSLMYLRYERKN